MNILFLNHKIQQCGVYQYGLRLFNILKKSLLNKYNYCEIENYDEYINNIKSINHEIIIYNYHNSTMTWLNHTNIQKNVKNIGISHESDNSLFDIILSIDPDEIEINNIYNIPRPIYENVDEIINTYKIIDQQKDNFINYNEGPDIPIFGSFGFGFLNKGFDKIISIINSQYDRAIIKLIITFAHFDPNNKYNINNIIEICNSINRKIGIKLMITHQFFTNEEILIFLKSNTCNIFLYDKMYGRGISSVIDYAISVNNPIIISDSYMFRNIYSDDICIYKTDIKTAIENAKKIIPNFLRKYSNSNLINKVDNICKDNKNKNIDEITTTIFGCKISAYYHINNFIENGNVTNKFMNLMDKYKYDNQLIFNINNNIFLDILPYHKKTLFININYREKNFLLTAQENENINLKDIIFFIEGNILNTEQNILDNLIEVSIGEIVDKYSILEIKNKYIKNCDKLNEINKEMKILEKRVEEIKKSHFYKQLLYINEKIWIDTDNIKKINDINDCNKDLYVELSKNIFENNQKRFRVKKYFNILQNSNIKECKSYSDDSCFIIINSESQIYDKIPEINYLCISHDSIYFNIKYKEIIYKLFKNPNIIFIEENIQDIKNIYDLSVYKIQEDIKDIFDFDTIKYISGGKLGDFLNQLSVICEKFYETGKKGELFITDLVGDSFTFGVEYTYKDTYSVISSQKYIKQYKIYDNTCSQMDIDLSFWRKNIHESLFLGYNWFNIYSNTYNVLWGKHRWLEIENDKKWNDKIIINVSPDRFISTNAINILKEKISNYLENCIFISNEPYFYDYFIKQTDIKIKYYQPKDFKETVLIINSCKLGFFCFSSFSVIANTLHKENYMIGINNLDFVLNNLKDTHPFILDIFV